jgi:hypothetical protein
MEHGTKNEWRPRAKNGENSSSVSLVSHARHPARADPFGRASTILPRGYIPSQPFGGIATVLGATFAGFHDHENRQSMHHFIINGYNIEVTT